MIAHGDRLAAIFAKTRAEKRAALIPYIMAGDPDEETTALVIDALTAAGADLIELGIPYSDPLADGPTVAAAGQRALEAGTTTESVLRMAAEARARNAAPIQFFTYVNPVSQFGPVAFAKAAAAAGALGAIIPDIPLEEIDEFAPAFAAEGLGLALLVAPTTPAERAARIIARSDGFVYLVSRLGVTGARREPDIRWISQAVAQLRAASDKPIGVGFGISTPAHVRALKGIGDGIFVGSALIDAMFGKRGAAAAEAANAYLTSLREAL
jgi:tryptophan synthase alpha chain